jgi:hypothetical protein
MPALSVGFRFLTQQGIKGRSQECHNSHQRKASSAARGGEQGLVSFMEIIVTEVADTFRQLFLKRMKLAYPITTETQLCLSLEN